MTVCCVRVANGSHHQEKEAEEDAEERQYAPVVSASAAHHYADYDADRRSDSDVERQDSYDRSNSKVTGSWIIDKYAFGIMTVNVT